MVVGSLNTNDDLAAALLEDVAFFVSTVRRGRFRVSAEWESIRKRRQDLHSDPYI
jgi:hypothetical protein